MDMLSGPRKSQNLKEDHKVTLGTLMFPPGLLLEAPLFSGTSGRPSSPSHGSQTSCWGRSRTEGAVLAPRTPEAERTSVPRDPSLLRPQQTSNQRTGK